MVSRVYYHSAILKFNSCEQFIGQLNFAWNDWAKRILKKVKILDILTRSIASPRVLSFALLGHALQISRRQLLIVNPFMFWSFTCNNCNFAFQRFSRLWNRKKQDCLQNLIKAENQRLQIILKRNHFFVEIISFVLLLFRIWTNWELVSESGKYELWFVLKWHDR